MFLKEYLNDKIQDTCSCLKYVNTNGHHSQDGSAYPDDICIHGSSYPDDVLIHGATYPGNNESHQVITTTEGLSYSCDTALALPSDGAVTCKVIHVESLNVRSPKKA